MYRIIEQEMRFELRFQQGTSFFPLYDLRTQDSIKYGKITQSLLFKELKVELKTNTHP